MIHLIYSKSFEVIRYKNKPVFYHDFWGRSQKAVSADTITDTILLKSSFYHVELFIVMIQSRFVDIYSGPLN